MHFIGWTDLIIAFSFFSGQPAEVKNTTPFELSVFFGSGQLLSYVQHPLSAHWKARLACRAS